VSFPPQLGCSLGVPIKRGCHSSTPHQSDPPPIAPCGFFLGVCPAQENGRSAKGRTMSQRFFTISVRFSLVQLGWLSQVKDKVLSAQEKHVGRSAILRGLCDGLADARVDLSTCGSEKQIRQAVARRLVAGSIGAGGSAASGRRNRREVAAL
jgi:hypothetical protein